MDMVKNECPKCAEPTKVGTKFCGKCGTSISPEHTCPKCSVSLKTDAKFCGNCGHKITSIDAKISILQVDASQENKNYIFSNKKTKSPVIASVLSCLLPGSGQVYLGQFQLGFGLMIVTIFTYNFLLSKYSSDSFFSFLLLILLWCFSIFSAYKDGAVLQQGQPIHKFGFFLAKLTRDEPAI